nr:hypothetical protein [Tanacetum cinerariifolium]
MKTQTSNTHHNAIMEAGSKDHPPMLAPGNYVQWKYRIKRYIDTKPNHELIHYCLENPPYKLGIDNDIYSIVDVCLNACEMWKAIERNRGKAIVNSPQPIYDQEPSMVDDDDETSKDKEIDKLMALISLSFKKIYKPTNNNLRTSSKSKEECKKPKRAKGAAYHKEKMLLCKQEEAGIQLNAEQADWKDDTDDEFDDQELEAHYMYMAKIQEASPDAVNSGPIFDTEPEQKVQNDDHYDVFAIKCQHPEQSKSIHETYLIEQDAHNVLIESVDMNYDSELIDQNDEDADLA